MDMTGALRARLSGVAGGRIYWVERPQSSALPSVTLQIISDLRPQHLKGFDELRDTRVQIDCWGKNYAEAVAVKEAALAALVPENTANSIRFDRAIVDGERDLGEMAGTTFIHRASVDLVVWWATA
jgi:hypothetical protein